MDIDGNDIDVDPTEGRDGDPDVDDGGNEGPSNWDGGDDDKEPLIRKSKKGKSTKGKGKYVPSYGEDIEMMTREHETSLSRNRQQEALFRQLETSFSEGPDQQIQQTIKRLFPNIELSEMDFKWNNKTKQIQVRTVSKRGTNITNIKTKWTKWNNLFKTDGSISPSVSRLTVFRDALQREAVTARQQIDENDKQIKLEQKKLEEEDIEEEKQDEIRNVIDELTVVSMECKELIDDPDKILYQRLAELSEFNKANSEQYVEIEKDFAAGINLEDQVQKNEDAVVRLQEEKNENQIKLDEGLKLRHNLQIKQHDITSLQKRIGDLEKRIKDIDDCRTRNN